MPNFADVEDLCMTILTTRQDQRVTELNDPEPRRMRVSKILSTTLQNHCRLQVSQNYSRFVTCIPVCISPAPAHGLSIGLRLLAVAAGRGKSTTQAGDW
jgi:hypothetical protein